MKKEKMSLIRSDGFQTLLASLICSEDAQSLHQIAALASVISEEIEYSDDNTYTLMYGRSGGHCTQV